MALPYGQAWPLKQKRRNQQDAKASRDELLATSEYRLKTFGSEPNRGDDGWTETHLGEGTDFVQ